MNRLTTFLTRFPLHSFLIIPFLTFFLFAQNTDTVKFYMTFRTLIVGIVLSLAIFLFSYFVIKKDRIKAGVFTTTVLIFFFGYGLVYDMLEGLFYQGYWPFSNIHRYQIIFSFIAFIALFVFIYKSKYTFQKLNFVLNFIIAVLILWNVIHLFTKQAKEVVPDSYAANNNDEIDWIRKTDTLPDIYYIIVDGFANPHILEKEYSYKPSDFVGKMESLGFYVADSARSNYYFTRTSLAATFNMRYLDEISKKACDELIRNNLFVKVLKKLGYQTLYIKSGYTVSNKLNNFDRIIESDGINEFERGILRYSILRLDDLFGYIPYIRIVSQFELLSNFSYGQESPMFLFTHIVCPHPPYVFDKDGKRRTKNSFNDNAWEPRELYLNQLIYVSKQIEKIAERIIKAYQDKPVQPIIIFQSDHGPYISDSDSMRIFNARAGILNAIYIKEKQALYPEITSVNTFRYVLKYVLKQNIELINDSLAGKKEFFNHPNFRKNYLRKED